jgi:hypothetical protein
MHKQLKYTLFLVLFLVITSCKISTKPHFVLSNNSPKVVIMLSPECPLCLNYTKDITDLIIDYNDDIHFYGIVAGSHYSTLEVDSFLNSYNLPLDIIYDPDFNLTSQLNATITPEVFLIDEHNKILYQGLFDNWLGELGRRRQVITEHYLKDAIDSYLVGSTIEIPNTKAIGCFIE